MTQLAIAILLEVAYQAEMRTTHAMAAAFYCGNRAAWYKAVASTGRAFIAP